MIRAAIVAVLLVGCTASHGADPEAEHVLVGWTEVMGDPAPGCEADVLALQVVRAPVGACPYPDALGRAALPAGLWACRRPGQVLIREDAWGWRASLVRGQVLHVLAGCELGDPDEDRTDPRLWTPPGGLDTVIMHAALQSVGP